MLHELVGREVGSSAGPGAQRPRRLQRARDFDTGQLRDALRKQRCSNGACILDLFFFNSDFVSLLAAPANLAAQGLQQTWIFPRFQHEIAYAPAHGFDCQLDRPPGRHCHHGQRLIDGLNSRQQIQTLFARRGIARVIQIHQQQIVAIGFKLFQHAGRRIHGLNLVTLTLEQQAESFENVRLIVGDKRSRRFRFRHHHVPYYARAGPRIPKS